MSIMKNFSILTLLLYIGTHFYAQTTLSAKDAVFTTLEKNFKVLIAKEQVEIAEKNNQWSEAGAYPTVSLNIGYSTTIQDNRNNPFTFTPGVILSNSISPNLSFNYNIFSGFAVRISKERLAQLEEQSKGNALVIIESTVQDVLKAYYNAKLQSEKLKLLETIKKNSAKRLSYYEIKEKYAKSGSLELLQFQNQFLTDSTNYLLQQISYNNSMRYLLLLMNNSEDPSIESFPELTDALDFPFPELNLSELQNDLKANNQQLKNQYIAQELQHTATEFQKSFLYPTLSLSGGMTPNKSWLENLQNSQQQFTTQVITYNTGVNLRYTIFNNWKNKRAFEVAKIQEEIATMNTENLERSLLVNLANLSDVFSSRKQLVNVSEQNFVYATKAWELAQKRFDMGTLSSVELLNFQNNYQSTLMQHYENQYNKLDSFLEIYRLTGKIALDYKK